MRSLNHFNVVLGNMITLVNIELKSDDTINGLALKYGCSVTELKRVNKLIRDQDLYALSFVKVPVVKHGTVHELIQKEVLNEQCQNEDDNSEYGSIEELTNFDTEIKKNLINTKEITETLLGSPSPLTKITKTTDKTDGYFETIDKNIKDIKETHNFNLSTNAKDISISATKYKSIDEILGDSRSTNNFLTNDNILRPLLDDFNRPLFLDLNKTVVRNGKRKFWWKLFWVLLAAIVVVPVFVTLLFIFLK